jgi:hypothetical protein
MWVSSDEHRVQLTVSGTKLCDEATLKRVVPSMAQRQGWTRPCGRTSESTGDKMETNDDLR